MDLNYIFDGVKDHRVNRTKAHPLENILFISMDAVICGAETWNEIEAFGEAKFDWLRKHLDLSSGIPSHDTFNRFFSILDPEQFEDCFRKWVGSMVKSSEGDVISLDGKTIRGSRGFERSPLHIVSAWSNDNKITLGQIPTSEKSNEITAIPELLNVLSVAGSTVTIDAMGCQEDIAEKIIERGADYVLAVKRNQKSLFDDIHDSFRMISGSKQEEMEADHGRIEYRQVAVSDDLSLLENIDRWKDLRSIVQVISARENKTTGETNTATRYYITSLPPDVDKIAHAIRSHWGIENNLHWMLDVAFNEDAGKKRNANAILNFSLLNKIALAAIRSDKEKKVGAKSKRLIAAWDNSYLEKLMAGVLK